VHRSYLFAPGNNAKLIGKVFEAGADAVILDLEDAVPPGERATAREMVRAALASRTAWVRVNASGTDACAADLDAVAGVAAGIRIPKAESPDDVAWVTARAPGLPVMCAIETARGVLAAAEIAAAPSVVRIAIGGIDLRRDLGTGADPRAMLYARSHLVIASRAAGIEPPVDSVYPLIGDDEGLRAEAELARELGFFGKSAIHPRQVPILNEVFSADERELAWAAEVLRAFEASGGRPTRLASGEFVDLPVAQRARRLRPEGEAGR
jgi:citrate lyase subunit beta / citryl-CoA lyase